MERRKWLIATVGSTLLGSLSSTAEAELTSVKPASRVNPGRSFRVRPSDAAWPAATDWAGLSRSLQGRLQRVVSPFEINSIGHPTDPAAYQAALVQIKNPFYIGDEPALTQTSGWIDAWRSQASTWLVAAENAKHVAAAVNFARVHKLRLVVKGAGHSYQGGSQSPDSLLIWTRKMKTVQMHESFVASGSTDAAQPAVTVGAGAMWIDVYDAVTTKGGRYVQGGGCTTVGVAGLIQGGGFGNFSKRFGLAAGGLLEAEVVTADGQVRVANAQTNPDLFWALKGGGGGSFGVITRLTLRTRELPATFGAVFGSVQADSDESYRSLVTRVVTFYREALFNPHWGEQISLVGEKSIEVSLVFQDLKRDEVESIWKPFLDWINSQTGLRWVKPLQVLALPARHFWDADFLNQQAPGIMKPDGRPGAASHHAVWSGDIDQAGWFIHGYGSAWLPASLLEDRQQSALVDALLAAKHHWDVSLHFNKGLAGAPPEELTAARGTAVHPHSLDAFALAVCAGGGRPAFPGLPIAQEGEDRARTASATIARAMAALRVVAPGSGSYVNESDYFQSNWTTAFWGNANYERLLAIKRRYDPAGLFFVRHGVGSEDWSDDGFTYVGG